MSGYVHSFESLAAVDGEGLRCAVFLSGCPLRCVCCHNPDTWDIASGTKTEADTLVKKITRYKTYFGENGGVTFSGGEPLLQAEFLSELVPLLEKESVKYIIDTSAAVPLTDNVKYVLENSQSVLLDIKFPNSELYEKYTGKTWDKTIAILKYLELIGKPTVVRTVIIPGINDSEEVLDKYVDVIKEYSCITKYELLAFHTLGFHKYDALEIKNPLLDKNPLSADRKNALQVYVNKKFKPTH